MSQYTYEIIESGLHKIVLRSDGACIPMVESNSDYQRYLRWLENPNAEESAPIAPTE